MDCSQVEFQVGDELIFQEGGELLHGTVKTIRLDGSLTMEVRDQITGKFKGIWTYAHSEIIQSLKLIKLIRKPGSSKEDEREKERERENSKHGNVSKTLQKKVNFEGNNEYVVEDGDTSIQVPNQIEMEFMPLDFEFMLDQDDLTQKISNTVIRIADDGLELEKAITSIGKKDIIGISFFPPHAVHSPLDFIAISTDECNYLFDLTIKETFEIILQQLKPILEDADDIIKVAFSNIMPSSCLSTCYGISLENVWDVQVCDLHRFIRLAEQRKIQKSRIPSQMRTFEEILDSHELIRVPWEGENDFYTNRAKGALMRSPLEADGESFVRVTTGLLRELQYLQHKDLLGSLFQAFRSFTDGFRRLSERQTKNLLLDPTSLIGLCTKDLDSYDDDTSCSIPKIGKSFRKKSLPQNSMAANFLSMENRQMVATRGGLHSSNGSSYTYDHTQPKFPAQNGEIKKQLQKISDLANGRSNRPDNGTNGHRLDDYEVTKRNRKIRSINGQGLQPLNDPSREVMFHPPNIRNQEPRDTDEEFISPNRSISVIDWPNQPDHRDIQRSGYRCVPAGYQLANPRASR